MTEGNYEWMHLQEETHDEIVDHVDEKTKKGERLILLVNSYLKLISDGCVNLVERDEREWYKITLSMVSSGDPDTTPKEYTTIGCQDCNIKNDKYIAFEMATALWSFLCRSLSNCLYKRPLFTFTSSKYAIGREFEFNWCYYRSIKNFLVQNSKKKNKNLHEFEEYSLNVPKAISSRHIRSHVYYKDGTRTDCRDRLCESVWGDEKISKKQNKKKVIDYLFLVDDSMLQLMRNILTFCTKVGFIYISELDKKRSMFEILMRDIFQTFYAINNCVVPHFLCNSDYLKLVNILTKKSKIPTVIFADNTIKGASSNQYSVDWIMHINKLTNPIFVMDVSEARKSIKRIGNVMDMTSKKLVHTIGKKRRRKEDVLGDAAKMETGFKLSKRIKLEGAPEEKTK